MFYFTVDDDIQLKILEIKYAEDIYSLVDQDRNYLREWLPWVDSTKSSNDTKVFIQSSLDIFARNDGFQAAIFYKGKIAGCIGLHGIDWNNKKTSIGYWLSSEHQGNGVMTKSCKAIIDYIFGDLQLNRVEIRAAVENRKSRSVPERLGFKEEGIIRKVKWLYDHFVDHVVYGILKEDWGR